MAVKLYESREGDEVEISLAGSGYGSKVRINGVDMRSVEDIKVESSADGLTRVFLTLSGCSVNYTEEQPTRAEVMLADAIRNWHEY